MAMGTTARLLGALALAVAASACGGGGGGGGGNGGGGDPTGPTTASFSAANSIPPAGSMSLQQGNRSGLIVNVLVSATDVNDFFGTGFTVLYDPTVARFDSVDTSNSFLRDPPFNGVGADLLFQVDSSTPGTLVIAAARQQNPSGSATGVNVGGTRDLLSLRFTLLVATAGSPVDLPSEQRDVRDSQDSPLALPWLSGSFLAN